MVERGGIEPPSKPFRVAVSPSHSDAPLNQCITNYDIQQLLMLQQHRLREDHRRRNKPFHKEILRSKHFTVILWIVRQLKRIAFQ